MDAERAEKVTDDGEVRREYASPRLVRYGDLRELTAGQGSTAYDMEFGSDFN